jgi:hypothetical protein
MRDYNHYPQELLDQLRGALDEVFADRPDDSPITMRDMRVLLTAATYRILDQDMYQAQYLSKEDNRLPF